MRETPPLLAVLRVLLAACLTITCWLAHGRPAAGQSPSPKIGPAVDLRWDTRIPMRDGVTLHATLYVPRRLAGKAAAVLNMTPYSSDGFHREAMALARRGFVFAAVSVRGRGNSEGEFEPWNNDGRDGRDVVEWLASQPWSSGTVGMMGHSYGGRAVWSTLKEAPPHLASALPISASFPMRTSNNIQTPDALQWILYTSGVTHNLRLLTDTQFWWEKHRELYFSGRPQRDFDLIVGFRSKLFQTMRDHPTLDDYWDAITPTAEDFRRIKIPVLSITGALDHNTPHLWFYEQHQSVRPKGASPHYLLIGPWGHAGTLRPGPGVGGIEFGEPSQIDMKAFIGDWFDHTLRDGPRPALLEAPVRYYVAGTETWRGADTLSQAEDHWRTFHLASRGPRLTLTNPGKLVETRDGKKPSGQSSVTWTYDPLDVRPGSNEPPEVENWLIENSLPDDLYGAGVAYVTSPFETETDLVGRGRLSTWLSLDVPDTDFIARLDLLLPDGTMMRLGEDWVRARFRNGLRREELVTSTDPIKLRFVFPFMARTLPPGSRLRLIVRSPSSIFFSRHFNSGGPVADQSAKDSRVAHIHLLQDAKHPSQLKLPLRPAR